MPVQHMLRAHRRDLLRTVRGDQRRAFGNLQRQFMRGLLLRPQRVDMRAGLQPACLDDGCGRIGGEDDNIGVADRLFRSFQRL